MKIGAKYSHLNGLEFLLVHQKKLWGEIEDVIASVDAEKCRTKISKEKRTKGNKFYAPKIMNEVMKQYFEKRGWKERRRNLWLTTDEKLLRKIIMLPPEEQKQRIEEAGYDPISSNNQTDFVKNRVAVEVQFGKYSFVAHDLFVKHMTFFVDDTIDVGVEILPMKSLEKNMSSGVPYYERDLANILRQGRAVPAVPLVLVGIEP